ncbi:hypothetical protein CL635_02820 [bacterium]|jgi:transcriptional regulator with XRE-family HTH domain|nr:hypothetical protein [bacterium]|tara:strand:- start:7393 stop:8319 length:927 start_codon:yes stop_codon:yes gene_type:complete
MKTTRKAAEVIRKKRRSLRLSLHECERQSGISRRTVSRCERGEFFASGEKVEQLVSFLFKGDAKEKKRVMKIIDAELELSEEEMRERAARKRKRTEASHKLACIPVYAPRFDSTKPIKKEAQTDGSVLLSADPDKALHTQYKGSDVYLVISEKKRGGSRQLFTITPDSHTFFDYEVHSKLPKDVQGKEAIKQMWLYCTRALKLGDVAVFDLAEHTVKNISLFNQFSEKGGITIHKTQLEELKGSLKKARKIKDGDMKNRTARGLLIDDSIAKIEYWLSHEAEIIASKKKLLRRIATIRSTIESFKNHS